MRIFVVRRQGLEPRTRGLRAKSLLRNSAPSHVKIAEYLGQPHLKREVTKEVIARKAELFIARLVLRHHLAWIAIIVDDGISCLVVASEEPGRRPPISLPLRKLPYKWPHIIDDRVVAESRHEDHLRRIKMLRKCRNCPNRRAIKVSNRGTGSRMSRNDAYRISIIAERNRMHVPLRDFLTFQLSAP